MSLASELIKSADLEAARAALQEQVKAQPNNVVARFELAEVLLLLGDWARADNQYDLVSTQDTSYGVLVALIRQLIRAELARAEVFAEGRAPELIGDATTQVEMALRVLVEFRAGGDAAATREAADAVAPSLHGTVDGRDFTCVRDLDDATADVLEVLTSTGKYFWIPWSQVRALHLRAPEHLRDLIWRPADLDVIDGPDGVVYIPTTYVGQEARKTGATRLGRETDWVEDGGLTRGVGLRCLLLGDEVVSLSDFSDLTFKDVATK